MSGMGKCKGNGIVALILGVLFLLGTLNVLPSFTFGTYWPLFLIAFGLHGLFCSCGKGMGKDGCGCEK